MEYNTIDNESLRQRFNPDGSVLRRHQMRMLELLLELDRICKKHNINYWLSSGTLLGAARHKGFIPWDDDLDVELMRKDYLRLMEVLPGELPETMTLQSNDTDASFFSYYAKLRDRRSVLHENNDYDRCWKEKGIYIDIVPLEKQPIWLHLISEKTTGHMYKIWRTSTDDKKSIKRVMRIFKLNNYFIYPVLRLLCKLIRPSVITSGLGIPFHNPRYERNIFPLTTMEFEGHQFPVPHNTDQHLREIYGDYMKLPDLNRLNLHVGEIEIYD